MGAQKLSEVAIGSTPSDDTHFLVTQPETVEGSEVEAVRRVTTGDIKDLMADGMLAPKFSVSTAYTAGQYVSKNGTIYRFVANHTGEWTGTDAEAIKVTHEMNKLNGNGIDTIKKLTQEQYDDIENPSPTTLYIIVPEE